MTETSYTGQGLVAQLAAHINDLGLAGPASVALELFRPLGFVGSQLLLMFGPLFGAEAGSRYNQVATLLEDRQAVDQLLSALQAPRASRITPSKPTEHS